MILSGKAFCFCLLLAMSPLQLFANECNYTGSPSPTITGEPLGELRLMTLNIWGQNDDSEAKCDARLRYIGEQIAAADPPYDVVGLTEVHPDYLGVSCDGNKLVNGIRSQGGYGEGQGRWGHPETPWYHYDGGTSLFSTVKFAWEPYANHAERYAPEYLTRTAHGFVFARLQFTPDIALDVYVTHLYSLGSGSTACDRECRYGQIKQLAEGIHRRSANSGNPVVVMGDFNIDGPPGKCEGNPGYNDVMELLRNPRDVWMEAHSERAGYTYRPLPRRLDFMFILSDSYFTNSPYELILKSPEHVRLLGWEMPGYDGGWFSGWRDGPFAASDHLGVEATLLFVRR